MKTTIVIPTLWRGPHTDTQASGTEANFLYDATPLDEEGSLARALGSISVLDSDDEITVAVIAVPSRRELKQAVQLKVESIVAQFEYDFPMLLVGPDMLAQWRHGLVEGKHEGFTDFLVFDSCSAVHNLCLLAGVLTGAEALIFFYDDEVYDDPGYLAKALQYIGSEQQGVFVAGVTGYNPVVDESGITSENEEDWRQLWMDERSRKETQSFDKGLPRLARTSFAAGGNMVIHRNLFENVPFDPHVPHGVASDYLMNARFMGYNFFLDKQLAVKRMAKGPSAPSWYRLRQDIIRFSLGRAKLHFQPNHDRRRLEAEDLDPYPGRFLKNDLHDLAMRASLELASEYLLRGNESDAEECMVNIAISRAGSHFKLDRFKEYAAYQRRWQEFIDAVPSLKIWLGSSTLD